MPEWLKSYLPDGWNGWHLAMAGVGLGVTTALVSLVVVGFVLVRLPHDFFVNAEARRPIDRHPVLKVVFCVGRNLFGYFLILLGIALSLPGIPGQGLLTILMGVLLIDFPGKHHAERWLLMRRGVLAAVNRLRARFGKPALVAHAAPGTPPARG